MGRVITECPSCGTWTGPADGDAESVKSIVCDDCQNPKCQCGHGPEHHNNADQCSAEIDCRCAQYDPMEADHAA